MAYNPETETFFQSPATIVDSTPDGDTVQEGFDNRNSPALLQIYDDLNLLKAAGMIGVGVPATETARGIGRVATQSEVSSGVTGANGPAFVVPETFFLSGNYIGRVTLELCPHNNMRPGYYFMNGLGYNISTPQGKALDLIRNQSWWQAMEAGWAAAGDVGMRIKVAGDIRHLPNWFHTDGRGPVMRAVNGTSRQVGTLEEDALQEISGTLPVNASTLVNPSVTGSFSPRVAGYADNNIAVVGNTQSDGGFRLKFSASYVSRTATETRMLNRGMTPAIFLGV